MIARRLAVASAGALLAAAPAQAESGRLADFTARYSSTSQGSPTGLMVHVLLHRAGDPNGKPSPLRSAVIQGPAGLSFDNAALPQCTASDQDLQTRGSDACPADTQLTVGSFSAITGFGPPADPLTGDDHVFNGPSQLIEVITTPGGPFSPAFDRLTIEGSKLTAHPPKAPGGPPDGESSVRSLDFSIPVKSVAGRSLITTPPRCPSSRQWATTATFGFADGQTDSVTSLSPCNPPTFRVAVQPRRIAPGRATRFRVLVRSDDPRCIARARVHFARQALHTDGSGRATVTATLMRPGTHRVRASHTGCGRATARVSVRHRSHASERPGTTAVQ